MKVAAAELRCSLCGEMRPRGEIVAIVPLVNTLGTRATRRQKPGKTVRVCEVCRTTRKLGNALSQSAYEAADALMETNAR